MGLHPPLNTCKPLTSAAAAYKLHFLFHLTALSSIFFFRASSLLLRTDDHPIAPSTLLIFFSELVFSFFWFLNQAYLWRPVTRYAFPERLPADEALPALDVFVCTADPRKEPPLGVINTVISAMALDYPPEKLAVYLSDDGASPLTLYATRKGWAFARSWIPFCREYGIKCRCPEAYFSDPSGNDGGFAGQNSEFVEEREKMKGMYEEFQRLVLKAEQNGVDQETSNAYGRPPIVQVIGGVEDDSSTVHDNGDQPNMPLLVYVSREKRPSRPHHFKAGALNVLLRVSGVMTNAPHILVLDCDMYCNDPSSTRQAMCFLLDPNLSPSLAFVQFPQMFHNISKNDIYGASHRQAFKVLCVGLDGNRGPLFCGTCVYIKRKALLFGNLKQEVNDPLQLKKSFGPSKDFVTSLRQGYCWNAIGNNEFPNQDRDLLASYDYEDDTLWGHQVGFFYRSLAEDFLTGFNLHCSGWTSVYYNPSRPGFLGSSTTNLNDLVVQGTRWTTGLLEVGLSRFCPLIYGPLRMSIPQSCCFAYIALQPLCWVPLGCLLVIPQVCLFNGIPVYPKVTSVWFLLFLLVFLSPFLRHLAEVVLTGGSILVWWNEVRVWMLRLLLPNFFGTLDILLKWAGVKEASFLPTNKVVDEEQINLYHTDTFDFRTSSTLLAPILTLVILNMVAFAVGVARVIINAAIWEELFAQVALSFLFLLINYPVIEGMFLRKDKGRVSPSATLSSFLYSTIILFLGSNLLI